jgi:two-component system nitrate/nitrite response regulator NarL
MKILLVDDHALFRDSLAAALEGERGVTSVVRCGSVKAALEAVAQDRPDLVLLDYELDRERGIDFLRAIHEKGDKVRVLVVTASVTGTEVLSLMQYGASGVVAKDSPLETLLSAIRAVEAGGIWLAEKHRNAMLHKGPPDSRFTDRERQVLRAVAEGRSNKEIASLLEMSETSVKATLQRLFEKAGVRTRGSLVATVLQKMRHEL